MGVLLVLLGLLTGAISGAASGGATRASGKGPDAALVTKLQDNARGSVSIKTKKSTSAASFVKAGQNGDLLPSKHGSAQAKTHDFLAEYGALLGVENQDQQLIPTSLTKDAQGGEHLSFRQVQNGVPVFAGVLRAHLDRAGNLTAVNGTIVPDANINTAPRLSAEQAAARAIATVVANPPANEVTGKAADTSGLTASATLYVYRQGLIRGADGTSQLVYEVQVTNGSSIREVVFVHAHAGKVINRYSAATDALFRKVYDQHFLPGNLVWSEGDAFPGGLDVDQQNIVNFSGHAYNLFMGAFGRDSYDAAGHSMSIVNNDPSINCPNANWNGITTNYCNGVTSDDVVAHEWGHAYTEYTHGLIYQWQPGALNESYSDIWGETVDLINGVGTDSPAGVRTDGACSTHTPGVPELRINTPTPGICAAGSASFGPALTATGVSGDLVLVDDGIDGGPGLGDTVNNGCETPFVNAAALVGKIALIERGVCGFVVKVKNAQNAGATAVVVYDHSPGSVNGMGGVDATITISSLRITQANGNLLKTYLAGGTTNVTLKLKGSGTPQDNYRWLMGEDSTAFGGAIRDMWSPTCLSDPGKVSDAEYFCGTGDQGGVHTNSGVPNHGYALLVDGGTYNSQTVAGIGLVKAAHIYFRAQSVYQTPTTDFADHADALQASCTDLIGAPLNGLSTGAPAGPSGQSISAADCASVTAMIAAVELRTDPTQCGFTTLLDPNEPDLCAKAKKVKAHETDFTKGLKDWTLTNVGVFSGWTGKNWGEAKKDAVPVGGEKGSAAYATDAQGGNCDGGDGDVSGVMSMTSKMIKLPKQGYKSPRLTFDHYVATEFGFDGGNVKISINGGPFVLVPASAFLFNPYNTVLATAGGGNTNPLEGQEAFSGTDGGQVNGTWGESQIDLTRIGVAPGDTIQLRFDFGNDGCGGIDGWYIQNVQVVVCDLRKEPAPPVATLAVTSKQN